MGRGHGRGFLCGLDADAEQALLQLQPEELAVGDAQRGAARLAEVGGQHGPGAVPGTRAAPELADVVVA